jgi:signal transduction histidine kinase
MEQNPISFISHELRNPLAAMQLYLEMLEKGVAGDLNEQQKDMVHELIKSQQKMNELLAEFKIKYSDK